MIPPLWMLAAAAAVAYLLWSRQPAPAGLPPLSPIADPVGRPLPPPNVRFRGGEDPYPAAGGFTPNPFIPWAIVAALLWIHFQGPPVPQPAPAPGPAPVVGLDLRGLFRGEEASQDATTTAALLEELAGQIEWDGQQAEPRLRTGAAFDDLRRSARELRTRGVSLGARQPAVRDAIKTFLDQEAGTEGGPVDAASRAKWVKAYRAVSAAAAEATR
jgi:hypothetical protein